MVDSEVKTSPNVRRRCFETQLPELYRESKYCAGVGRFIRYSKVHAPRVSEITTHEEEAAVWLWYLATGWPSQPALPGWQRPIEWVFSPSTNRKQGFPSWHGDLWGVDETGKLVIIQGKQGTGDPFEDFVEWLSKGLRRPEFTANVLRREWEDRLETETKRPNSTEARPDGIKKGVLPYSNR